MASENKRPTRSQAYQHLLVEKSFSHEQLETFPNEESLHKKLNPFDYNEDILVLEDQLKERFWEIIEENLTERQLEIVNLLKEGKTQQETARLLKVNQSSITKCIAKNTLISLEDKTTPIAELYNKNISSFNRIVCLNEDTNHLQLSKIVGVMRGEPKQLIRIFTTSGKTIRTSSDHKFLTDRGWMKLGDIISNNSIFLAVSNSSTVSFENIVEFGNDGIEETYDLEVEEPWHNFIADGFIVHNSLNGNTDYSSDTGKVSYGGIVKKLAKIVDNDPEIKMIKQKISDIRNSSWI